MRRVPDGAACAWPRATVVLGLLLERYVEDSMVRITAAEESQEVGTMVRLTGSLGPLGGPMDRWAPLGEVLQSWRVLGRTADLEALLHRPGPRSCLRCRRINFGPCISATCADLQHLQGEELKLSASSADS